jgi:hypothetical protein
MFKLNITHKNGYNEIDQPNPLRWRIMLREKDVLHSQSGLIKCKDFFNDIVAFKQANLKFSIYNFSNEVKFNRHGLYFHLTHIHDTAMFCENLIIVNDRLQQDLKTTVKFWIQEDGSVVVLIPNKLWKNTYYISLVSMMIRLCNYKVQYDSWDSIFAKDAPINRIESAFSHAAKKRTHENGFVLPKQLRTFWYWAGKMANSNDGKKVMPSVVHNNGVTSWSHWMGEM